MSGILLAALVFLGQGQVDAADFPATHRWVFVEDDHEGGASGKVKVDKAGMVHLRYDFTDSPARQVAARLVLEKPIQLKSTSFRLRKPADARLRTGVVDSTGQRLHEPVDFGHPCWQAVNMDMLAWDFHAGGADDGELHGPMTAFEVVLLREDLETTKGEILLSDLVLRTEDPDAGPSMEESLQPEYIATAFDSETAFSVAGAAVWREDGLLEADFSRCDTVSLYTKVALFGIPQKLALAVEGGRAGNKVTIEFGSHFQRFGKELGALDGGPKVFTVAGPPDGWCYWGGENDGQLHLPLRFERLAITRGDAPAEPTQIRLKWLKCETEVTQEEALTLVAKLEETSENDGLTATVTGWNLMPEAAQGQVSVTFKDWQGAELATEKRPWVLPPFGRKAEIRLQGPLPENRNFVEAVVTLDRADGPQSRTTTAYVRPVPPREEAPLRPELPWGMGVYLYRYPGSDGYARMRRAAAMARDAGVKWSREEFSWARIETQPGEYDFDFYDHVVDTALEHGISVYGLLAYWSRWTKPYTEEGIDDFCAFTRATVRHFKDRIKHWEVYNEPNIFFWSGPKELYPVLLDRCYDVIKEEDPEAQVLGISTSGVDQDFIKDCLDAGARFDILTVHPYRSLLEQRSFLRDMREASELVGGRPVWITEMGWSTQLGNGATERRQAELLAQTYILTAASGVCPNVSWYDFRCDGDSPFYNEDNFGILRTDLTPKPAYRALATLTSLFQEGPPEAITLHPHLHGLRMGPALALWSDALAYRAKIILHGDSAITMKNLMGERLDVIQPGQSRRLTLVPEFPLFFDGASSAELVGKPKVVNREVAYELISK